MHCGVTRCQLHCACGPVMLQVALVASFTWYHGSGGFVSVLHGESNTSQASPRMNSFVRSTPTSGSYANENCGCGLVAGSAGFCLGASHWCGGVMDFMCMCPIIPHWHALMYPDESRCLILCMHTIPHCPLDV